jgi:hypothetical protein
MSEKTVWLVDENQIELKLSQSRLKKMLPEGTVLETIFPPHRTIEEYIPIIESDKTACIILDQKLKDTGYANYTGIELALFLRKLNPLIPIFILTNFPGDITENGWSVEDVFEKDDFYEKIRNEDQCHILRERLSRRIATYMKILAQAETRFAELLIKSLEGDLSSVEREEIDALNVFRTQPTMTRELMQLEELEKVVSKHKQFLQDFRS